MQFSPIPFCLSNSLEQLYPSTTVGPCSHFVPVEQAARPPSAEQHYQSRAKETERERVRTCAREKVQARNRSTAVCRPQSGGPPKLLRAAIISSSSNAPQTTARLRQFDLLFILKSNQVIWYFWYLRVTQT